METQNTYSYPIDKEHIKKIDSETSPAHKKYKSKKTGAVYDLTHAIDFLCEEGTPIKTALEGEVVAVVDNLTKNYNKWEAPPEGVMPEEEQDGNYVVLKHANKEFSIYSHIQYKKVLVKKGQHVKTGDLIGYCGITGWSIVSHLHFMVFRLLKPEPKEDFGSLEVRWK